MKELPKVYDPRDVESRIYKLWMDGDCFKAEPNPDKQPFSIVMPPPASPASCTWATPWTAPYRPS